MFLSSAVTPAAADPAQLGLTPEEIAWLKAHPVIRIGVDEGYAPYAFFDADGNYRGVSADFTRRISEMLGVKLQPVPGLSWAQIIQAVKDHEIDVITTATQLPERDAFLNFTQPYIITPLVVMTRSDNTAIRTTEDLANRTLALVEGYASSRRVLSEHAYMPINVHWVSSPIEGLRAVSSGETDAYVGVLGVNLYLAAQQGLANLKVAAAYDLAGNSQRYGVRKDWPELAAILDKALNAISEDEKTAIFARWVPIRADDILKKHTTLSAQEKRWVTSHPKVRIGVSFQDEPFEYQDRVGGYAGIVSEYLQQIRRETGLEFELVMQSDRNQSLEQTVQGKLDAVVAMSAVPEKWPQLIFTQPFFTSDLLIINRKADGFISGLGDLSKKVVAVKTADVAHEILSHYPLISVRTVHSTREALSMVADKQADAAIGEISAATYILNKYELDNVRYSSPVSMQRIHLRFAVNQDHPELAQLINKALDTITSEQEAAIRRHWMGEVVHKGIDPTSLAYWTGAALAVLAAFFFLFYVWNRRLAQLVSLRTASLSEAVGALEQEAQARELAQEALSKEKELAHTTLTSIGDAVISTDPSGKVLFMNPVAQMLTGWSQSDAAGRPLEEVYHVIDENTRERLTNLVKQCQKGNETRVKGKHYILIARDGTEHAIENTIAPIRSDPAKAMLGVVLVFQDVSHTRALTAQLNYQAQHDGLTGLLNRTAFEQRIEASLESAATDNLQHALLYLDLDQFKVVNDTCGHQAGDELLRQVSALMHEPLRERDTLARLGGDEFGILLEGCPLEKARAIGDKIRLIIEAHRFKWNKRIFRIGVSIGVVPIEPTSVSAVALLSASDMACFAAKESGRNRVHVVRPDDEEILRRAHEMEWLPQLEQALQENLFRLYFQRIQPVNAQAQAPHFEVLLRLQMDDESLVMPGSFIPAAERYGLMSRVDRWVIEHVFANKTIWSQCSGAFCAINLSGQSLNDPSIITHIRQCEENYTIDPSQICFEITETTAIANLEHARNFIKELTEAGYRFALDDFGSGLSSFPYLQNLAVHYIKIDGSFVIDMVENPVNYTLVESIVRIGKVMGMQTIAEFVQNADTLEALRRIGVDFAQGYFLHEPEALDALHMTEYD